MPDVMLVCLGSGKPRQLINVISGRACKCVCVVKVTQSPSLSPTFLFSSLPNTKPGIDNIWVGLVQLDFSGGRYKGSGKKK